MDHDKLQAYCRRMEALTSWPTPQQLASAREAAAQQLRKVNGRVAVMPIHGVIEQRMSPMGYTFGGFSTEDGEAALRSMVDNPSIDAIVLHVDSPGGSTYGVQEFSDAIFEARGKKKIYAVADSTAASAAYWIASAADTFIATPGGDVGSIGVYMVHADESKAWDNMGVKFSIIKAGKHKAEGNPFEPLGTEGRDYFQGLVDDTYGKFIDTISRNRKTSRSTVREKFGQGRLVSADSAKEAGMIDRVMPFSEVMGKLINGSGGPAKARANVDVLRARQEQRKRIA
jgi:signal peptide peptidase SppA